MAEQRVWKGDSEESINSVNQWMRSQPWWTQYLQSIGQDPNNTHLSKSQAQDLLKLAQANGAVVDEGNIEVDPAGNFNPIGHKLRNALIAGGIAGGAALGIPALAGVLGSGGAGAAGAAGASSMATPALTAGIPSAAGLGGAISVPGAVTTGLSTALPGALSASEMAGGALKKAPSILDRIMGVADKSSGILSDMAAAGQAANEKRDATGIAAANAQLGRDTFGLKAPGERMHQGLLASIINSASPSKTEWAGPGSGLSGQVPRATGGATTALESITKDVGPLSSVIQQQLLDKQKANTDYTDPNLAKVGKSSTLDKVVGGAATGAGLLKLANIIRKA